jgi:hypothetical protein
VEARLCWQEQNKPVTMVIETPQVPHRGDQMTLFLSVGMRAMTVSKVEWLYYAGGQLSDYLSGFMTCNIFLE